ncbi:MAG TPA: chemotaxis protein CheC [Chthonomonadales bacterium]|nr:chemotaxis protein CheC [Chthonomonadales bacterium]
MTVARKQLSETHIDALREVANIGTGNAVTALAELTGREFKVTVPAFGALALSVCEDLFGDLEALAVSVYMPVKGDVDGHVAFLFPFEGACELADFVLGRASGETQALDELEYSALIEVGNIIISSFLNALAELTDLSLPSSMPGIAVDMTAAILASLAAASPDLGDHALTITTCLVGQEEPIEGVFLFIPEPASLPVLFHALGMRE